MRPSADKEGRPFLSETVLRRRPSVHKEALDVLRELTRGGSATSISKVGQRFARLDSKKVKAPLPASSLVINRPKTSGRASSTSRLASSSKLDSAWKSILAESSSLASLATPIRPTTAAVAPAELPTDEPLLDALVNLASIPSVSGKRPITTQSPIRPSQRGSGPGSLLQGSSSVLDFYETRPHINTSVLSPSIVHDLDSSSVSSSTKTPPPPPSRRMTPKAPPSRASELSESSSVGEPMPLLPPPTVITTDFGRLSEPVVPALKIPSKSTHGIATPVHPSKASALPQWVQAHPSFMSPDKFALSAVEAKREAASQSLKKLHQELLREDDPNVSAALSYLSQPVPSEPSPQSRASGSSRHARTSSSRHTRTPSFPRTPTDRTPSPSERRERYGDVTGLIALSRPAGTLGSPSGRVRPTEATSERTALPPLVTGLGASLLFERGASRLGVRGVSHSQWGRRKSLFVPSDQVAQHPVVLAAKAKHNELLKKGLRIRRKQKGEAETGRSSTDRRSVLDDGVDVTAQATGHRGSVEPESRDEHRRRGSIWGIEDQGAARRRQTVVGVGNRGRRGSVTEASSASTIGQKMALAPPSSARRALRQSTSSSSSSDDSDHDKVDSVREATARRAEPKTGATTTTSTKRLSLLQNQLLPEHIAEEQTAERQQKTADVTLSLRPRNNNSLPIDDPTASAGADLTKELATAERLLQKAVVLRVRSQGLEHPDTKRVLEDLMRLYLAQRRRIEADELRDAPVEHVAMLARTIDAAERADRKRRARKALLLAAKSAAAASLLLKDVESLNISSQLTYTSKRPPLRKMHFPIPGIDKTSNRQNLLASLAVGSVGGTGLTVANGVASHIPEQQESVTEIAGARATGKRFAQDRRASSSDDDDDDVNPRQALRGAPHEILWKRRQERLQASDPRRSTGGNEDADELVRQATMNLQLGDPGSAATAAREAMRARPHDTSSRKAFAIAIRNLSNVAKGHWLSVQSSLTCPKAHVIGEALKINVHVKRSHARPADMGAVAPDWIGIFRVRKVANAGEEEEGRKKPARGIGDQAHPSDVVGMKTFEAFQDSEGRFRVKKRSGRSITRGGRASLARASATGSLWPAVMSRGGKFLRRVVPPQTLLQQAVTQWRERDAGTLADDDTSDSEGCTVEPKPRHVRCEALTDEVDLNPQVSSDDCDSDSSADVDGVDPVWETVVDALKSLATSQDVQTSADPGAKRSPVHDLADTADFGDGPLSSKELLVAWAPLKRDVTDSEVVFSSALRQPGLYHIRLMLAGTTLTAGAPCPVQVRYVGGAVQASPSVLVGDGVKFRFALGFSTPYHTADVWAGLFSVQPISAGRWKQLASAVSLAGGSLRARRQSTNVAASSVLGGNAEDGTANGLPEEGEVTDETLQLLRAAMSSRLPVIRPLYEAERPVASVSLENASRGHASIPSHPLYPGTYQLRVFASRDQSVCVARSAIIYAVAPFRRSLSHPHSHLLRELRVVVSASSSGTLLDREMLMRVVAPKIREIAEERGVSFSLVDLRQDVDLPPERVKRTHLLGGEEPMVGSVSGVESVVDRTMDLGDLAEGLLAETEACRPCSITLLTQSYGWVPRSWHPWVLWAHPWLRHATNASLPRRDGRLLTLSGTSQSDAAAGFASTDGQLLFGRPLVVDSGGRSLALDSAIALPRAQDLGSYLPQMSMLEMQILSSLALPRMQPVARHASIKHLQAVFRETAFPAAPSELARAPSALAALVRPAGLWEHSDVSMLAIDDSWATRKRQTERAPMEMLGALRLRIPQPSQRKPNWVALLNRAVDDSLSDGAASGLDDDSDQTDDDEEVDNLGEKRVLSLAMNERMKASNAGEKVERAEESLRGASVRGSGALLQTDARGALRRAAADALRRAAHVDRSLLDTEWAAASDAVAPARELGGNVGFVGLLPGLQGPGAAGSLNARAMVGGDAGCFALPFATAPPAPSVVVSDLTSAASAAAGAGVAPRCALLSPSGSTAAAGAGAIVPASLWDEALRGHSIHSKYQHHNVTTQEAMDSVNLLEDDDALARKENQAVENAISAGLVAPTGVQEVSHPLTDARLTEEGFAVWHRMLPSLNHTMTVRAHDASLRAMVEAVLTSHTTLSWLVHQRSRVQRRILLVQEKQSLLMAGGGSLQLLEEQKRRLREQTLKRLPSSVSLVKRSSVGGAASPLAHSIRSRLGSDTNTGHDGSDSPTSPSFRYGLGLSRDVSSLHKDSPYMKVTAAARNSIVGSHIGSADTSEGEGSHDTAEDEHVEARGEVDDLAWKAGKVENWKPPPLVLRSIVVGAVELEERRWDAVRKSSMRKFGASLALWPGVMSGVTDPGALGRSAACLMAGLVHDALPRQLQLQLAAVRAKFGGRVRHHPHVSAGASMVSPPRDVTRHHRKRSSSEEERAMSDPREDTRKGWLFWDTSGLEHPSNVLSSAMAVALLPNIVGSGARLTSGLTRGYGTEGGSESTLIGRAPSVGLMRVDSMGGTDEAVQSPRGAQQMWLSKVTMYAARLEAPAADGGHAAAVVIPGALACDLRPRTVVNRLSGALGGVVADNGSVVSILGGSGMPHLRLPQLLGAATAGDFASLQQVKTRAEKRDRGIGLHTIARLKSAAVAARLRSTRRGSVGLMTNRGETIASFLTRQGPGVTVEAGFAAVHLSEEASMDAAVYVRHPRLNAASSSSRLALSHTPEPLQSEEALASLRTSVAMRGDRQVCTYGSVRELASAAQRELIKVLDRHFPRQAVPSPQDGWAIGSAAFAASRSVVFVEEIAHRTVLDGLHAAVEWDQRRQTKPIVVLGPPGGGKSALIAHWCAEVVSASGARALRGTWRSVVGEAAGLCPSAVLATAAVDREIAFAQQAAAAAAAIVEDDAEAGVAEEEVDETAGTMPSSKQQATTASRAVRRAWWRRAGARARALARGEKIVHRSRPVAPAVTVWYEGHQPCCMICIHCCEGGAPAGGVELLLQIGAELLLLVVALCGQRTQRVRSATGVAMARPTAAVAAAAAAPVLPEEGEADEEAASGREDSVRYATQHEPEVQDNLASVGMVDDSDVARVAAAVAVLRDSGLSGDPPRSMRRAFTTLLKTVSRIGVRLILVLDGVDHVLCGQDGAGGEVRESLRASVAQTAYSAEGAMEDASTAKKGDASPIKKKAGFSPDDEGGSDEEEMPTLRSRSRQIRSRRRSSVALVDPTLLLDASEAQQESGFHQGDEFAELTLSGLDDHLISIESAISDAAKLEAWSELALEANPLWFLPETVPEGISIVVSMTDGSDAIDMHGLGKVVDHDRSTETLLSHQAAMVDAALMSLGVGGSLAASIRRGASIDASVASPLLQRAKQASSLAGTAAAASTEDNMAEVRRQQQALSAVMSALFPCSASFSGEGDSLAGHKQHPWRVMVVPGLTVSSQRGLLYLALSREGVGGPGGEEWGWNHGARLKSIARGKLGAKFNGPIEDLGGVPEALGIVDASGRKDPYQARRGMRRRVLDEGSVFGDYTRPEDVTQRKRSRRPSVSAVETVKESLRGEMDPLLRTEWMLETASGNLKDRASAAVSIRRQARRMSIAGTEQPTRRRSMDIDQNVNGDIVVAKTPAGDDEEEEDSSAAEKDKVEDESRKFVLPDLESKPIEVRTGESLRHAMARLLFSRSAISHTGAASLPFLRAQRMARPFFVRGSLARLMLCGAPSQVLSQCVRLRWQPSPASVLVRTLEYAERCCPLAVEALRLIVCSRRGLSESELVELLGGSRAPLPASSFCHPYSTTEAPGRSGFAGRDGSSTAATPTSSGLSLSEAGEGVAQPKPPPGSPRWDARDWSDARRLLLSCAVVRCRGLWCLDGSPARLVSLQVLLPTDRSRVSYLQRICAYFWTRPLGPRKIDELPQALSRLLAITRRQPVSALQGLDGLPVTDEEAGKRINWTAGTATASADVVVTSAHVDHAVRSLGLSHSRAVGIMTPQQKGELARRYRTKTLQRRRPSVMLHRGFPPALIFRPERLSLAVQLLAAVSDARHIAWLDSAGTASRDGLVRLLASTGLPRWLVAATVRDSFEAQHGLQGYPASPAYHKLRGVSFHREWKCTYLRPGPGAVEEDPYDLDAKEFASAVQTAARQLWKTDALASAGGESAGDRTFGSATSGIVGIGRSTWNSLRRKAPSQLRALARALLDCGVYDDAADLLASAMLMELNCPNWLDARKMAVRIARELDNGRQPPSVLVSPKQLPPELGTGSDARAMLRSRAARSIAAKSAAKIRRLYRPPSTVEVETARSSRLHGMAAVMTAGQATKQSLDRAAAMDVVPLAEGHAAWDFELTVVQELQQRTHPLAALDRRAARIHARTLELKAEDWGPAIDDVEETVQIAATLAGLWAERLKAAAAQGRQVMDKGDDADPLWVIARLPGGRGPKGKASAGGVIGTVADGAADAVIEEDDGDSFGGGGATTLVETVLPRMPSQKREAIWPPAVIQRLVALYEIVVQLDRIVGPAHPACLQVQASFLDAAAVASDLVELEIKRAEALRRAMESARAREGR
jgi:hypothetical protein